jgi:hypothetical protein
MQEQAGTATAIQPSSQCEQAVSIQAVPPNPPLAQAKPGPAPHHSVRLGDVLHHSAGGSRVDHVPQGAVKLVARVLTGRGAWGGG